MTLVNLEGSALADAEAERFKVIQANACDLGSLFEDRAFDVVFSNSVIEHVGDEDQQRAFAHEAMRLGRGFWVQTPSDRFPVEAHTGVPYYWRLPEAVRTSLKNRWRQRMPTWTEMIDGTRVISQEAMRGLFPRSEVYIERRFGFEKSYAFYRPFDEAAGS